MGERCQGERIGGDEKGPEDSVGIMSERDVLEWEMNCWNHCANNTVWLHPA